MKFNLKRIVVTALSIDSSKSNPIKAKKLPSNGKKRFKIEDPKQFAKMLLIALVMVIFTVELVFGVMIYGFKMDNTATKSIAKIIPYPAAFTASGIVTVSQYWNERDYIEHFYASTKQESLNSTDLSSQILKQEAENAIIKKEAIQYKINVSNKDVDAAMEEIYTNNGGQAEVEKALQDLYGLNVASFKNLVRTQLLRDAINKNVIKHVKVRHILIRLEEGADQTKIDEAKARIDSYRKEITDGTTSFEEAAKKYSEDVGSNSEGGELEAFARGDMVKEFEDVAFATPVGEISEPFRSSFGWHILQTQSVTGYADTGFDEWLDNLMKNNLFIRLYSEDAK